MNASNPQRLVDLVIDLIGRGEAAWVEFKHNNADPERIGILASAISNAARLAGQHTGYVLWGVQDQTHNILGTIFDPDAHKVGNQVFALWLAQRLSPSIVFQFHTIQLPQGRVVLMEIPAATAAPVSFDNIAYLRIGSATPKLTDYPERYQALLAALRPYAWEHEIALQYLTSDEVLALLDYAGYFQLTAQRLPDNRAGILEHLQADQLIARDVGDKWNITNLGAILFAAEMGKFPPALARKAVRFVAYDGPNRTAPVTQRRDGKKGYANGFEGLLSYITGLLPRNEHIGIAFRQEHPLYPDLALRELVANALIHQDMTISGAGPQIELFSDRIEITNPGCPLIKPDRMIDMPPRSRNEMIASLMRRMRLCEEQGSGLDKVIDQAELFQLPAPLLREAENAFQAILYAPRKFAQMTQDERVRACYHHAVLKLLSGDRMKNSSLCERLGIEKQNAAQATNVINAAIHQGFIKPADPEHPRSGYVPTWA
jgi:ATP-dependent DNA helicase RecG